MLSSGALKPAGSLARRISKFGTKLKSLSPDPSNVGPYSVPAPKVTIQPGFSSTVVASGLSAAMDAVADEIVANRPNCSVLVSHLTRARSTGSVIVPSPSDMLRPTNLHPTRL